MTDEKKTFILTPIARALDHLVKCPFYIYMNKGPSSGGQETKAFLLLYGAVHRNVFFVYRKLRSADSRPGGDLIYVRRKHSMKELVEHTEGSTG